MEQQQIIDALVAEKTALDQSYVQEIRNCLELRKQHLIKDKYIEDLNKQIQKLLEEKNVIEKERDDLKHSMSLLASEAQSTEG